MNSANTKLFVFTLPQEIIIENGNAILVCNIVVMPRFNPEKPLALQNEIPQITRDFIPFAESDIQLTAFLVKGNELPPNLDSHDDHYAVPSNPLPGKNNNRQDIFSKIGSYFNVLEGPQKELIISTIKKYLPGTYKNASGFAGTTKGAVTDDSYFCALKADKFAKPGEISDGTVNWSQVMAFCLHQPKLAAQLGMLYEGVTMALPSIDYFSEGGWVYADFKEDAGNAKTYSDLPPESLQRYAAWIPALAESRPLFSPVLFPVETSLPPVAAPGTFDDIFDEVLKYNDGYAKIVHASQPVSTNHLLEEADGSAPVKDMGIRLAWDDEQVLEWYNRGFQSMGNIGKGDGVIDTPLVVSKYRLDVAEIDPADIVLPKEELEKKLLQLKKWKSQVSVTADNLKTEDIDLGSIDAELGIQVAPAKHGDAGAYWLPMYFANWNGTCLSVPDPLPEQLHDIGEVKNQLAIAKAKENGGEPEKVPEMMYRQNKNDKVELKYGETYAFRVRLSDISGGGPKPNSVSSIKADHKIATHTFKRYVIPQPPAVTPSADELSLIIERPRLNYPAILYTNVDTQLAITELLADKAHLDELRKSTPDGSPLLKKSLREVSLPDPDVTQVEIVVEIKSLEMDRADSYNALNGITPKESFVFLYKTFRNFPTYLLSHDAPDDIINLELAYHDISGIHLKSPADSFGLGQGIDLDNGPLHLPTGREARLKIRAFCPGEKPGYFATEASKYSIARVKSLRKDPLELEPVLLLDDADDPLISLFFQPTPSITGQYKQEQQTRGKGNESETDLFDRLASVTKLINRNGSLMGENNVRIQFGCSALINHAMAPDKSSITFASRENFFHKWISVIQLKLNRDWTWDLLQPDSFRVSREWRLEGEKDWRPKEEIGGIYLTKGLNWQAMDEPDRSFTKLVFIDAFDPKPEPNKFPQPLEMQYFIEPQFKQVNQDGQMTELLFDPLLEIKTLQTLLPVTTKPLQVPVIASVGIALSPDSSEDQLAAVRYAETINRNRYLWVEFKEPLTDPGDMYFARVLSYAPDPMLAAVDDKLRTYNSFQKSASLPSIVDDARNKYLLDEQTESPINLDPETIRVVRPGQIKDQSGMDAMQAMIPATSSVAGSIKHFLLPLPTGLYPDSEDLFGFFTYEFRVGHFDPVKWSTAQGRFGSPLRLTGVQHPAPAMNINVTRDRGKILVGTRHAESYFNGKNCTPVTPRTDIFALLYAQVLQADGYHYRNIQLENLLLLKPTFTTDQEKITAYNKRKADLENHANPYGVLEHPLLLPGTPPYAVGLWNMLRIKEKLRYLGISENASLSVLCVEVMPRNDFHNYESVELNPSTPIETQLDRVLKLDQIRILRTSRLCPVTDTCAV